MIKKIFQVTLITLISLFVVHASVYAVTRIRVPQGGTGVGTIASSTLMIGTGTGNVATSTWTIPMEDGSANYILKTDGSGAATWQADISGVNPFNQWLDTTNTPTFAGLIITGPATTTAQFSGITPTEGLHFATKDYVDITSEATISFFYSTTTSDIDDYNINTYVMTDLVSSNDEASIASSTIKEDIDDQLIFAFAIASSSVPFTTLAEGSFDSHFHIERTVGNDDIKVYYTVVKRDSSSVETVLMTSELSDLITSKTDITIHANQTNEVNFVSADRVVIKFYANAVRVAGTADNELTLYAQGNTDSHSTFRTPSNVFTQIFLRQDGTKPLTTEWTTGQGLIMPSSTTTGSQYYSDLAIPAGTWLAISDTGKLIATTSPPTAHDSVTLAGQDYLTLIAQQITAGEIEPDDLANSDFGGFNCDGTTCTIDDDFIKLIGDAGMTGVFDFGGVTSFEIPNAANPTVDTVGEIALDTTDSQFLVADSSGVARVVPLELSLFAFSLVSTSVDFISGGIIDIPKWTKDGRDITQFKCHVDGGTSVVVNISDGTNDTETITCATTQTSDTDVATNSTFNADELWEVQIGTITGTVDYLIFEAYGYITRE